MHRFMLDTSAIIKVRKDPELASALRDLEGVEFFTTHVQDDEDHGEPIPGLAFTSLPTSHVVLDYSSLDEAALGEPDDLEQFVGESRAKTLRDALITASGIGSDLIVVFHDRGAEDRMSQSGNLRHLWTVARLRDWAFRQTRRRG